MFIYPDAQYIWHIYLPKLGSFLKVNAGKNTSPMARVPGICTTFIQPTWTNLTWPPLRKNPQKWLPAPNPRGVPSLNAKGMVNWHPLNGTIWHPNWKVQVGDISSLNRSNWGVPWCTAQVAFLLKLLAHPCLPRCRACWEHLGSFLWRAGEFILKNPSMS